MNYVNHNRLLIIYFLFIVIHCSCSDNSRPSFPIPDHNVLKIDPLPHIDMERKEFYYRLLGLLVGSAIGDAMGAPVEMWHRSDIQKKYGFIDDLIFNARAASAEGPWQSNMPSGTSTDDTRWKYFMGQYFLKLKGRPNGDNFSEYIIEEYDQLKNELIKKDGFNAEKLEESTRYLTWLQEWAKVAKQFRRGGANNYSKALAKFYGGEMSCAGMLYAPMLGALYPGKPKAAYEKAFELSIFDMGYAKDITAMTAAFTSQAFKEGFDADSLWQYHFRTDPHLFSDSRLIGRISSSICENAINDYNKIKKMDFKNYPTETIPSYFTENPARYFQLLAFYKKMDGRLESIPFHANEIYMITLSTLLYAEGDFMDAMVFVTNYGRDNDTVGAIVGAILGAQIGFLELPKSWKEKVLAANKKELKMDLEKLTFEMGEKYLGE